MKTPITLVIVGLSGYGGSYLKELLDAVAEKNENVTLIAGIDPFSDRCQYLDQMEELNIPIYSDLNEFYTQHSGADLAVMSPPIQLHAPLTCLALTNGSNVLCEKPLCATVQEALKIDDTSRKSGKFTAIGYQWSFSNAVQEMKNDIMSGKFGAPIRLKTLVFWPRMKSYYKRNNWAGKMKTSNGEWVLDSPANNATAHYLHNMFYILGKTRETSAEPVKVQAELYRAKPIENFDSAAIRCQTTEGHEILFYTTHSVFDTYGPVAEYQFENGKIFFGSDGNNIFTAEFNDGRKKDYGNPNEDNLIKLWDSVQAIQTGKPIACDARAATPHIKCVNGAQESMQISPVPEEIIRINEKEESELIWIDGIQEIFTQCFEKELLPFELGDVPWSKTGNVIDLTDYNHFPSYEG